MSGKGGRPPLHPGGVRDAVRTFLGERSGTFREIAAATGYKPATVRWQIAEMRKVGDSCLANWRPASNAHISDKPSAPPPALVVKALNARLPLEQAWGAGS